MSSSTSRPPTLADRIRLADLLVHADRGGEALPILLGVADEQTRYGFREKALEALRRADAIAPGDPATRERFVALAPGDGSSRAHAPGRGNGARG